MIFLVSFIYTIESTKYSQLKIIQGTVSMTKIFYCKKLVNDLNVFNHGHHNDAIRKSISIFLHRDNLKSIGKISAKKDNFYFSDYLTTTVI